MSTPGWDLPMEATSGDIGGGEVRWAGAITVLAATVEHPVLGFIPALVFRFSTPDLTGMYAPISLVLEDGQLDSIPKLLEDGIRLARAAAEVKNRV